jgi:hypothetical protein
MWYGELSSPFYLPLLLRNAGVDPDVISHRLTEKYQLYRPDDDTDWPEGEVDWDWILYLDGKYLLSVCQWSGSEYGEGFYGMTDEDGDDANEDDLDDMELDVTYALKSRFNPDPEDILAERKRFFLFRESKGLLEDFRGKGVHERLAGFAAFADDVAEEYSDATLLVFADWLEEEKELPEEAEEVRRLVKKRE